MADDGNRQVALTLGQVEIALGLHPEQFEALDLKLGGIRGAVDKLTENVSPSDTSVAAEIALLKQEIVVGFNGINQSIANLNEVIFERSVDLAKWLATIALASSTPDDNSATIQAIIDKQAAEVRAAKEKLQSSIDRNNPIKPEGE